MAHTPGPWEVCENDASRVNVAVNSFLHPSDAKIASPSDLNELGDECHDDWNICQCDQDNYSRNQTECEANARLIAAAPDLLAALESLHAVIDFDCTDDDDLAVAPLEFERRDELFAAFKAALAAMAKAKNAH